MTRRRDVRGRGIRMSLVIATVATCVVAETPSGQAMTNGIRLSPAPTCAALVLRNIGPVEDPWCSGAVVGDGWILTAAHCVHNTSGALLRPKDLRVLVGADRKAKGQGSEYGVARVVPMPGFKSKV